MEGLSQETIAVIGAAVVLAGLILRQGSRIDKRFDLIDRRLEQIQQHLTSVVKEISRIGGLIEGRGLSGVALPGSLA